MTGPAPYTGAFIPHCPDCEHELIDEGFGFWCPRCQAAVSPAVVARGETDD